MARKRSKKTERYRAAREAARTPSGAARETAGVTTGAVAAGTSGPAALNVSGATVDAETIRVPVHEEELAARTREVERGAVRIQKEVVSEEQTLAVPVVEERVRVVRHVVDRDATDDDAADAFIEGTIAVPVRGEEIDLTRTVRTVEEVEVGKDAVQHTEQVGGTVRREEVHVEGLHDAGS